MQAFTIPHLNGSFADPGHTSPNLTPRWLTDTTEKSFRLQSDAIESLDKLGRLFVLKESNYNTT